MTARRRRLGVAVELPEPWCSELAAARLATGDPAAAHMAPHITLLPPVTVDVPTTAVEAILRGAAAEVEPFEVHLRGTGTFRPVSDVVFVAVAAGIASLEQLARAVTRHPLDPPRQFPYHPHVTVAHDLPAAALDAVYDRLGEFEARFDVTSFRLYEHAEAPAPTGQRWFAVADFPLGEVVGPAVASRP
jgi:2'-5' RNA ligase